MSQSDILHILEQVKSGGLEPAEAMVKLKMGSLPSWITTENSVRVWRRLFTVPARPRSRYAA